MMGPIKNRQVILAGAAVSALSMFASLPVSAVEEIVVTAQKREESLQSVPAAVTAFSGVDLKRQSVQTLEDIQYQTPSLVIYEEGSTASSKFISIRGQKQSEGLISSDPAVGIYADGVYMARNPGNLFNLVDVQRVEILKGPQGTLYGRNTTGGAINVITNLPEFGEASATLSTRIGNFERRDVSGIFNVPLGDTAAVRVVASANKAGPQIENNITGVGFNDDDEISGRGALRWQASDATELIIRAEAHQVRESGPGPKLAGATAFTGFCPIAGTPTPCNTASGAIAVSDFITLGLTGGIIPLGSFVDGDLHTNQAETYAEGIVKTEVATFPFLPLPAGTPYQRTIDGFTDRVNSFDSFDLWGVSGALSHDFGVVDSKLIIAYRDQDYVRNYDLDGTPFPLLQPRLSGEQEQFSAELNLSGLALDDRLDWLAGVFYFREEGFDNSDTYAADPINPRNPTRLRGEAENTSQSAFVHLRYNLTEKVRLEGGVRYTEDEKNIKGGPSSGGPPANNAPFTCGVDSDRLLEQQGNLDGLTDPAKCFASFSETFDAVSWTAGVDFQFLEEADRSAMVYVKASKGFRAGGQNLRSIVPVSGGENAFEPETVHSYEVGLKSDWWDGRFRLNAAAYYQDYEDIQQTLIRASSGGTLSTFVFNAAKATIQGAEVEALFEPVDNLTFFLTGSWIDPQYDEFGGEQLADPALPFDPVTNPLVFLDRSGETFPHVVEWTYSLAGQYVRPTQFGEWATRVDWSWSDDHPTTNSLRPELTQEAYGLLSARTSVTLDKYGIELALWGKNLTDEEYFTASVDLFGPQGHGVVFPSDQRTWGGELTIRFGG